MKTIQTQHIEDITSGIDSGEATDLYSEFIAASDKEARLEKKLIREENKVTRLGFPPKKLQKIASKLKKASEHKLATLSELSDLRTA
jgi:hypothetical protein